jgi:hypothetical protein
VSAAASWLLRAAIAYTAFELLAPFAIVFGGGWPRIAEGAAFAIAAATIWPIVVRHRAARRSRLS